MNAKRFLGALLALVMVLVLLPTGFAQADSEIEIANYEQLKAFAARVNAGETELDVKLTADITCTDKTWTPIGDAIAYQGTFDGLGHTITGLSNADVDYSGLSAEDRVYIGLFGCVYTGKVQNVTVAGCDFSITSDAEHLTVHIGAIVGYNSSGTVVNCRNVGSLSTTLAISNDCIEYIGGGVGYNYKGTVVNCVNTGAVSVGMGTDVGGVVGYNSGTVKTCLNTGSISGGRSSQVGGIVGLNTRDRTVEDCLNTGTVLGGDLANVGGVGGYNAYGTVKNCLSVGAVSGGINSGVGGAVGSCPNNASVTSYVENCYFLDTTATAAIGDVGSATVTNVAALTAEQLKSLSNCVGFSTDTWAEGPAFPLLSAFDYLIYDANGGTGDMPYSAALDGYTLTAAENAFTNEGSEFTGWNTKADGEGDPVEAKSEITLGKSEVARTLYAQWKDAVVSYPLWVGGVQVTEENKDNILNDGTDSVRFRIEDGKYFLTLDNADISTYSAHDVQWWRRTANIFFNEPNINLTVELIGDNTLSGAEGGIVFVPLDSSGVVTLTGEGSLSIDGSNFDVYGFGILHIDDTTLIAGKEAEQNTGSGLYARGIEIDGSSVQAYGKYYAIMTENPGFTVTDSCVVAKGEGNGVYINGPITIGGDSILIAEGSAEEGALRVYRDVTLNDGIALVEPENAGYVSASGGGRCVANPDGSKATRAVYAIPYPLYVGGVHVTSANADDVLNDGTVKFEITDEGENVLTLTNATVTGVYEEAITERTYNVYSRDTGFALTVKPIGENSLSGAKDAISLAGALQLTGDGTLTAEASNAGISVRYGITVDGPTVKAGGIAYGVWTGGGTLSVKGTSKLTAEATGGMAIFAKTIDIDEGLSITTPTGARVDDYGEAETVYDSNIAVATKVVIEPGYLITFRNEDGTELQSYPVAAGETPVYEGETPVKAPTVEKLYTFAGWKLSGTETVLTELPAVDGEATYIAAYTESDRVYTGPVWAWTGYTKAEATFTAADDATFTQTVTATGDAIVNAVTTEPTCTEKGERTYTATVTFLGAQYSDKAYEPVDETGHDWAEPTYEWEAIPGGYTCTATRVCKNDAAHTESETVGSTYAVIEAAKPYVDGLGRYTSAAFANEAFAVQTMDEAIPMLHVTYACDAVNALDACLYENGEWLYRVDVRVTNLPDGALDIDSAQLFLTYDHELLALRRTEGMVDWIILDRGDMLSAVWASDADVSVKDGDAVLTLYFALAREANADEIAALAFTRSERGVCAMSYVNDGVVTELNADTINGGILFETPIYGDANGDGMVTAADAALILRAIVGLNTLTPRGMFNGDADGDGEITAADAALILRFVVGLIDHLPVQ